MHHFAHHGGVLHAEDVPVPKIAAEVGTPFYCYSTATLTRHYRVFDEAFAGLDHLICYSLKANSNQAVVATLARLGAAPTSSRRASFAARSPPAFRRKRSSSPASARRRASSPSDSSRGIHCFNVESEPELELLSSLAASRGVDAPTSRSASTRTSTRRRTQKSRPGARRTSSACPSPALARSTPAPRSCRASASIGIDTHIGSQLTELDPFDNAFRLISELVVELRADGHAIEHVDLGGGLGIPYRDDQAAPPLPSAYAETVRKHMNKIGCRVIFEPGRLIAGNAGILVTEVLYVKEGGDRTFVIVDAAMNDLVRPTLYDA